MNLNRSIVELCQVQHRRNQNLQPLHFLRNNRKILHPLIFGNSAVQHAVYISADNRHWRSQFMGNIRNELFPLIFRIFCGIGKFIDAVRHILIGWFFKAARIQVFRVVAPCTLLSHLHHLCQWFLIAVQEEHSNCNEGGR